MANFTVTMTEVNGTVHTITDAADGQNLMELAKAHGVAGIAGDCGGGCACATCHVYVDGDWWDRVGEPDSIELDMLDMVADVARPQSRLGCQVRMSALLDGLKVSVAPSE